MQPAAQERDKKLLGSPDQATSRLSPALHYGEISVKRMYHMVKHAEWQWMQVPKAGEASGKRRKTARSSH